MAKKITELTELTTYATNDLLVIEDVSAGTTKKITWDNLIAASSITAPKLATNAITLGYASITSSFTTASGSAVLVTGLSAPVTIPAGGRRVKITAFCYSLENNTANKYAELSIWDGTVGSGTRLAASINRMGIASESVNGICIAVHTPSAGAKTYNIGLLATDSGTAQVVAGATSPAFILVETI